MLFHSTVHWTGCFLDLKLCRFVLWLIPLRWICNALVTRVFVLILLQVWLKQACSSTWQRLPTLEQLREKSPKDLFNVHKYTQNPRSNLSAHALIYWKISSLFFELSCWDEWKLKGAKLWMKTTGAIWKLLMCIYYVTTVVL